MPKIVDHAERRDSVADAVLRVMSRDGIRSVTMRNVAEESGWSTGVLNHYFENKDELLRCAMRRMAALVDDDLRRAVQAEGVDRLRRIVVSNLPMEDERRLLWARSFLFFFAEAAADP